MSIPNLKILNIEKLNFYLLEKSNYNNSEAVIFLHGIGENRSGLNYIFSEISNFLTFKYDTFQFDWMGLGENPHDFDLSTWEKQFFTILEYLKPSYKRIHIIFRAICKVVLPPNYNNGLLISIGNASSDDFQNGINDIFNYPQDNKYIYITQKSQYSKEEELFWYNLGVEPSCVGGLKIPKCLLKTLKEKLLENKSIDYIFTNEIEESFFPQSRRILIFDSDPLFRKMNDRKLIKHTILEVLQNE